MTNQELIQKAQIVTDDLASGGKLNPKQAEKFIDYVIDVTELKGSVRTVKFSNEKMQIDKIGVSQRVAMPKVEARAPHLRRGVQTSQIELEPKDIIVPWEISDSFPDQCIEGEDITDTVTRLMATQTANDMEELLIDGNTLGPARLESDLVEGGSDTEVRKDTYIELFDGWLRLADSGHVYDAGGADISSAIFSKMILEMPKKFRRTRRNLRFFTSMDHEQLYREKVGARQTGQGDRANQTQEELTPFGVPLSPVPLLDAEPRVVEHVTFAAAPDTQELRYAPIGTTVYITPTGLGVAPQTPYTEGGASDYTVNRTTGEITTVGGGTMAGGGTYKVTYQSQGQSLLTDYQNLIFAIGKDIRIERGRDIFASMNQFVITARIYAQIEETDAVVKGINIGLS